MKKFILYFFFILYCSSLQAANYKKYTGSGELKLSENTFDILELTLQIILIELVVDVNNKVMENVLFLL